MLLMYQYYIIHVVIFFAIHALVLHNACGGILCFSCTGTSVV